MAIAAAMVGYLDAPPSSRAKSGLWATRVRQFLRSDMEKSLSAREKAVSMLHPPISVGSCAWSHARSRSAWGEASARAMLSKDLRMRLCANSRASHATLGGVCCGSASPAQHDFFKYRSQNGVCLKCSAA